MGKIKFGGVEFNIQGDEPTIEELRALKQIQKTYSEKQNPAGVSDAERNPSTGYYDLPEVSSKIRFAVSAAPNLKSKIQTLEKFYSEVKQDPFDPSNFIVTDTNGKKFILDDKSKTNLKDVIDFGKEITQVGASTAGAILGAATGPGAIVTAGAGMAAGSEIYERLGQLAGTEIDRDIDEYLKSRGVDFLFGAGAQAAGPLLLRGGKFIFRGSEKPITEFNKKLLGTDAKGAKKMYDQLTFDQKIDKGLRLNMPDRLALFEKYNVKPTLGQVTENAIVDSFETAFARIPVSAQILKRTAEKAQDQLGINYTKAITNSLKLPRIPTSGEVSGVVKRGLKGERIKKGEFYQGDVDFGLENATSFINDFKVKSAEYYGKLAELVRKAPAKDTNVLMKNTLEFLENQTQKTGLKNLDKILDDPLMSRLTKGILKDLEEQQIKGTFSYKAADAIRKKVGSKLDNPAIYADESRALYKGLYRSINDDIANTLEKIPGQTGNRIREARSQAFNFTRDNRALIDDYINPLTKKVDIDTLTDQLLSKAKAGATTINALTKALGPDRSRVLVASMVDRLGKVQTSERLGSIARQNTFSTELFINNLKKISPDARKALFANPIFKGKDFGTLSKNFAEIEDLAKYIEQQNPFKGQLGTALTRGEAGVGLIIGGGASVAGGALLGGAAGAVTGGLAFLAGVPLLGYGGATIAKLLSNPAFVRWVASTTKEAALKGFDGIVQGTARLGSVAGRSSMEEAELTNQYLELIKIGSDDLENKRKNISQQQSSQQTAQAPAPVPQAPAPVNTQVTDPTQFASLFPQDALGQAIAQRNVI
jgi:uncharacterized protein YozE (UPF0346 family)